MVALKPTGPRKHTAWLTVTVLVLLVSSHYSSGAPSAGPQPGAYEIVGHMSGGKEYEISESMRKQLFYIIPGPSMTYLWERWYSFLAVTETGSLILRCRTTTDNREWTGEYRPGPRPMIEISFFYQTSKTFTLAYKGPIDQWPLPPPSERAPFREPPACQPRQRGSAFERAQGSDTVPAAWTQAQATGPVREVDGSLLLDVFDPPGISQEERSRNIAAWGCLVMRGHPELELREVELPQARPQRVLVWPDARFSTPLRLGALYEWSSILPEFCGGPVTSPGPAFRAGRATDPLNEVVRLTFICDVAERGLTRCRTFWLRRP